MLLSDNLYMFFVLFAAYNSTFPGEEYIHVLILNTIINFSSDAHTLQKCVLFMLKKYSSLYQNVTYITNSFILDVHC